MSNSLNAALRARLAAIDANIRVEAAVPGEAIEPNRGRVRSQAAHDDGR